MSARGCYAVLEAIARMDVAQAEADLRQLLEHDWTAAEVCQLAGLFHYRRALQAEAAGDGGAAADHWERMIPHLVYALENTEYAECFRAAREKTYGQAITAEDLAESRRAVYQAIEGRFDALERQYAQEKREADSQRIQGHRDVLRLEQIGSRSVARLGGIPDGRHPARTINAGPSFARLYGIYKLAQSHIQQIPVKEKSALEQVMALFTGGDIEDPVLVRREAGYCFSPLALPFVHNRYQQPEKALGVLKQLAEAGQGAGGDGAANGSDGSARVVSEAAQSRLDARQLAMEIRLAVGAAYLLRGGPHIVKALAYWTDAIRDVEVLDKAQRSALQRQGSKVKSQIQRQARQNIRELTNSGHWAEALSLAEALARMLPRDETLRELVGLLVQMAVHASNEQRDHARAVDYLKRAKVLAPRDPQLPLHLLTAMQNHLGSLLEKAEYRPAAERCMDLISLCKEIEAVSSNKHSAREAKPWAAGQLLQLLQGPLKETPDDFGNFALAFLVQAMTDKADNQYSEIEGIRLARRAQSNVEKGLLEEACQDLAEALPLTSVDGRIAQFYEDLTSHTVGRLIEAGALDRATEIAERAAKARPSSKTLARTRIRVMLRRLDQVKLLGEDSEEVSTLATLVESWLGEDAEDQARAERGRRFVTLIDPELANEARLDQASRLVRGQRYREALCLLQNFRGTGRDALMAAYSTFLSHEGLGNLDSALACAERMVAEHPNFGQCYRCRAKILSLLGRFDDAETDFMILRNVDEDDYTVVQELALNAYRAGRYADSIDDLRLARDHGIDNIQSFLCEAMSLIYLDRRHKIPELLAKVPAKVMEEEWYQVLFGWLAGAVTDDEILAQATNGDRRCEAYFWLGEKLRSQGEATRGAELIEKCIGLGMRGWYEYQHAVAIKNGGRLEA